MHHFGRLACSLLALSLWAGVSNPSQASSFSVYSDAASWTTDAQALGGITTVTIPEPVSPFGYDNYGTGDASVTFAEVVFSQSSSYGDANLFNVGSAFSGSPPVISSQPQTTGLANITITVPYAIHAFAVNFATILGQDVTFDFSNGISVTIPSSSTTYDTVDFLGLISSEGFTSVTITADDAGLSVNNVSYVVPEPGSLLICGLSLLCLAARGRFSRRD
ncbi:MAG: PEP-CTERM sorting domain-containing protein [Planctomycetes bacterium]|nr:PEP-CTERM sorting domain-containing protein [Planctomycetota bacterium]